MTRLAEKKHVRGGFFHLLRLVYEDTSRKKFQRVGRSREECLNKSYSLIFLAYVFPFLPFEAVQVLWTQNATEMLLHNSMNGARLLILSVFDLGRHRIYIFSKEFFFDLQILFTFPGKLFSEPVTYKLASPYY